LHSTAQHSTAQHSTAQHSTAQHISTYSTPQKFFFFSRFSHKKTLSENFAESSSYKFFPKTKKIKERLL
jgi:hypothetical protein